ncbi:MAG: DUF459 domain-containing protein [Pseudomonas sp.]|uniref:SGNH/GDSL hydrolase family protein n=1 Tax=Pseudomonas abieticivorans TaxID=2931382 RepID=UPI0020BF72A2|nr:SGNH family hydrolase [Pseudomonas sp. PIA16]MDE1167599.1 DUF459 domain-containing protein [Pseudomonas sp.]
MQASDDPVLGSLFTAIKVLLGMLVAALILTWLNQDSMRLYCQQKYHGGCAIPGLADSPAWALGGKLTLALADGRDAFLASLAGIPVVVETPPVIAPVLAAEPILPLVIQPPAQVPAPVATLAATLAPNDEVFLVGDSLMQGVAPHLVNSLHKRFNISSVNLSKQSTGLAYPSFFNWPQTVEQTLHANPHIRLIVVFLGPNDPWDMPVAKGKPFLRFRSADWETLYRQRVASIFEQAKAHNAQVIWVGPPNMRTDKLSRAMTYLSQLYKTEAQRYGQLYVSANEMLGYKADEFSPYLQDADGKRVKTRGDDGIHFTPTGQKLIATRVLSLINVHTHDITER